MPAAVKEYLHTHSFVAVADVQNRILNEYIADMAKYAHPATAVKKDNSGHYAHQSLFRIVRL